MVSMAVTTHAPRKSAGELVPRAMSASTMKMPEPIMEPITIAVALNRPRVCTSLGASSALLAEPPGGAGMDLWVVTERFLPDFCGNVFGILQLQEANSFIHRRKSAAGSGARKI